MRRVSGSRLLLVWYTLLCLVVIDLAAVGLAHYMAGVYRRAVWDEFNAEVSKWHPVEKVPYADIINRFGKTHQISPQLAAAVIEAESSFQPRAVSPAGAYGLMQIIPDTWRYVNNRVKVCQSSHQGSCTTVCYFQPELNIGIGTVYLSELVSRYKGNIVLALAAYNAGPGAVDRYSGIPPYRETEEYVKRVINYWYGRQGKLMPVYDSSARRWEQAGQVAWVVLGILASGLAMTGRGMTKRHRSWRWR